MHQKTYNISRLNIIISSILILSFILKIIYATQKYLFTSYSDNLNDYSYSEFLINFQGGFVRRGLSGEILYQIYNLVNYPLVPTITIISYAAFFAVVIFFCYKFHQRKYCWWILLSPLILNFTTHIVRKDFLLFVLFIGILYLLQDQRLSIVKSISACVLTIIALFLHEAFIFWGVPIYALLLLSEKGNKPLNYLLILSPLATFIVILLNKGTLETASAVIDSWNSLLPGTPLIETYDNSIGAIGWDTTDALIFHLRTNAEGDGYVLIPIYLVASYYMLTNYLYVFNTKYDKIENTRLTLSILYILEILCLIPMFTILSCDTGRVFQYASIASFGTFLIIPHGKIISCFPKRCLAFVRKINSTLIRYLSPSKGLITLMLLFIGISPSHFSLGTCWRESVLGSIFTIFAKVIKIICSVQ